MVFETCTLTALSVCGGALNYIGVYDYILLFYWKHNSWIISCDLIILVLEAIYKMSYINLF